MDPSLLEGKEWAEHAMSIGVLGAALASFLVLAVAKRWLSVSDRRRSWMLPIPALVVLVAGWWALWEATAPVRLAHTANWSAAARDASALWNALADGLARMALGTALASVLLVVAAAVAAGGDARRERSRSRDWGPLIAGIASLGVVGLAFTVTGAGGFGSLLVFVVSAIACGSVAEAARLGPRGEAPHNAVTVLVLALGGVACAVAASRALESSAAFSLLSPSDLGTAVMRSRAVSAIWDPADELAYVRGLAALPVLAVALVAGATSPMRARLALRGSTGPWVATLALCAMSALIAWAPNVTVRRGLPSFLLPGTCGTLYALPLSMRPTQLHSVGMSILPWKEPVAPRSVPIKETEDAALFFERGVMSLDLLARDRAQPSREQRAEIRVAKVRGTGGLDAFARIEASARESFKAPLRQARRLELGPSRLPALELVVGDECPTVFEFVLHPDGTLVAFELRVGSEKACGRACVALAQRIANTIDVGEPGPDVEKGERLFASLSDVELIALIPRGWSGSTQNGEDFTVVSIQRPGDAGKTSARMGIYVGWYPKRIVTPAGARVERYHEPLMGIPAEWFAWTEDRDGAVTHVAEAIVEVRFGTVVNAKVHVFLEASDPSDFALLSGVARTLRYRFSW